MWPHGRDRWNLILVAVGLGFTIWLAIIILSQVFGDHRDVTDDALLIGAAAGFLTLLLNQVHHGREIEKTAKKVDDVYEHVNNVEEQEAIPADIEPERPTLGSMLRRIDRKVDALGVRLDAIEHPLDRPAPRSTVRKQPPRGRKETT